MKNSHQKIRIGSIWRIQHWRGEKLVTERIEENLCPDDFINYVLDAALSGGSQVAAWYIVLFSDNHTPAAGDTYAAPGFTENTGYNETARPAWAEAGVSAKQITNNADKATFTMDGSNANIYGAGLVSVSTKGDTAGGGVLGPVAQFSGGAITGIQADDVIKVDATVIGSDAG